MDQKRHAQRICEDLRLDPESRLCPAYNSVSIKKYHLPSDEMGVRVVDNCAEENMRKARFAVGLFISPAVPLPPSAVPHISHPSVPKSRGMTASPRGEKPCLASTLFHNTQPCANLHQRLLP